MTQKFYTNLFLMKLMVKNVRGTKTFSSKRSRSKKYAKAVRRVNRKARY